MGPDNVKVVCSIPNGNVTMKGILILD